MNTVINATLNPLVGILRRFGLLAQDLDYHVIRASMVIIFLFFGYRQRPVPDEGRCPAGRLALPAEAGCGAPRLAPAAIMRS
jgi:hypothetical protein